MNDQFVLLLKTNNSDKSLAFDKKGNRINLKLADTLS